MYRLRFEIPADGQLCLCRCPGWCDIGYQVARFEDDMFQYDEQSNDMFDANVIAWLPLEEDGVPILVETYL